MLSACDGDAVGGQREEGREGVGGWAEASRSKDSGCISASPIEQRIKYNLLKILKYLKSY